MQISGNMMNCPLLISSILTHAVASNPRQEIVSALGEGKIHRYTYANFARRTQRLALGLRAHGLQSGERVATLAWNTYRHLEIYYATAGLALICHTVNPRLHTDQVAFIINDAQDSVVFHDVQFSGLVDQLRPLCPTVRHWVVLDEDGDAAAPSGDTARYSGWLAPEDPGFAWPVFDENTACGLCYTSGTTGNPKGALYSHRSTVLHAYASCHPDAVGVSRKDAVMPLVPMYHVNAWGLPYASLLSGAKIVMPGPDFSGQALHTLCEAEGVTLSAGVPSIWQILLEYVHAHHLGFTTLARAIIGGSACPPAMITALGALGVSVRHAWGMTEVSPLGTVCFLLPEHENLPEAQKLHILAAQGRPLFGARFSIRNDEGQVLPHDGQAAGNLMVQGPWVIDRYYGQSGTCVQDGWFHTGDVASIDADGYVRISDRSKDVIKSGGEWISSIEIENIAMEHPGVRLAACIARPDVRWGERPVLVVVRHNHASSLGAPDILSSFENRVARWMIPDEVFFIEEMPMTATGKMQKSALRSMFFASQEAKP